MKISITKIKTNPQKVEVKRENLQKKCEYQLNQINDIIKSINSDLRKALQ